MMPRTVAIKLGRIAAVGALRRVAEVEQLLLFGGNLNQVIFHFAIWRQAKRRIDSLPRKPKPRETRAIRRDGGNDKREAIRAVRNGLAVDHLLSRRSEERRVGKECRSR